MQPIEERIGSSVALPRLYATLVSIFAGASFLLAALGVMAYSVMQRQREIGRARKPLTFATENETQRDHAVDALRVK